MSKKNQQTPDTDILRDEAIMPEAAKEAPEAKSSRIRLFSSLLSEDEEKQPDPSRNIFVKIFRKFFPVTNEMHGGDFFIREQLPTAGGKHQNGSLHPYK